MPTRRVGVRRARIRWRAALAALLATLLLAGCASAHGRSSDAAAPTAGSASPARSSHYPSSMVALGDSGATGYDSDPASPGADASQNSWAAGTNPAVRSIYSRLLAVDPAIRGHASNVAVDGSDVTALAAQVDTALKSRPTPELFLIQSVDNDLRCDGTDAKNSGPFGQHLTAVLQHIARSAPHADILIVSSPWATAANYTAVAATSADGRSANSGSGPCNAFSPDGKPQPAHVAYAESVTRHYLAELEQRCKTVPQCRYDGGALHAMRITAADLSPDFRHLSIAGPAKQAAVEWTVLSSKY